MLAGLRDQQGFECIKSSSSFNPNTGVTKHSNKILYDFPEFSWLKDPKADLAGKHPFQTTPDSFGLWPKDLKRPSADRYLLPNKGSSEEEKEYFLSCPPASCADLTAKEFLESKPLVKSVSTKKVLDLKVPPIFTPSEAKFKDFPLFSVTDHHARRSLGNNLALSQVVSNMKSFVSWLISHWEDQVDISQYPGTTSPGNRDVQDEVVHSLSVQEQIVEDIATGNSWLFNTLTSLRDGLQLVANGLHSSSEINVATLVASRHHGRSVVLNHCSENANADYKADLDRTKYNQDTLFGSLPLSYMTFFSQDKDTKGYVRVLKSDIQNLPGKAGVGKAGGKGRRPFFRVPNKWARGPKGRAQSYGLQRATNNLKYIKSSVKNSSTPLAQGAGAPKTGPKRYKKRKGNNH